LTSWWRAAASDVPAPLWVQGKGFERVWKDTVADAQQALEPASQAWGRDLPLPDSGGLTPAALLDLLGSRPLEQAELLTATARLAQLTGRTVIFLDKEVWGRWGGPAKQALAKQWMDAAGSRPRIPGAPEGCLGGLCLALEEHGQWFLSTFLIGKGRHPTATMWAVRKGKQATGRASADGSTGSLLLLMAKLLNASDAPTVAPAAWEAVNSTVLDNTAAYVTLKIESPSAEEDAVSVALQLIAYAAVATEKHIHWMSEDPRVTRLLLTSLFFADPPEGGGWWTPVALPANFRPGRLSVLLPMCYPNSISVCFRKSVRFHGEPSL
jgi:hypothetical protein